MLRVEELDKSLPGFKLQNISFHLKKGYLMGIIGPNGAGKSTLIKTIMNVYRKDYGRVFVDGIDMQADECSAKDKIGFILDENFFEEGLSSVENAKLFGRYYTHYDHSLFLSYCSQFELDPKKKLKKLSKGMGMMFQLAFALSHKASLLILDEPTASLDPTFRKQLLTILCELISDGEHSVLLSTHLTDDLDHLADYVTFIDNGTVLFSLSKEELGDRYQLVSGEHYKMKLLPKELILHYEIGQYSTSALILKKQHTILDPELTVSIPTIEDIMYYMVKGGIAND